MKKYIFSIAFSLVALLFSGSEASAATLNLLTDKTQFAIGDTFSVDVKIDSEGMGINAAQATINYPVGVLQETAVSKDNSVFNFWLQEPSADNTVGKVSFIGGSQSGLDGKTLQAIRISFKVVGTGAADISFTDGAITASDGNGTNVLSTMKGLNITSISKSEATRIPAPVIPPVKIITRPAVPTGKLPDKPILDIPLYSISGDWYNSISSFIARWNLPSDVTAVVTELNRQPVTDIKNSEGLFDNKTFPLLSDGVWYLHVRFKNDVGWGPVADYKIGIDTVPPLPFAVTVKEGSSTYISSPTLVFQTQDQPSGVEYYRITVDGNEATTTSETSYTLSSLSFGKHSVLVQAVDFAGNKTSTTIALTILERPFVTVGAFSLTQFQFFAIMIFIILALFGFWWFSYRSWERQLRRRVMVAERDVSDTLNVVSEDTEKIIELASETKVGAKETNEIKFLAEKIKDKIAKAKKYIVDNIRDISQR